MCETILMSIKPKYAKKIYTGEKTIEIRKRAPKHGAKVIIYETAPVQAVTGMFFINNKTRHNVIECVVKTAVEKGCVTEKEFKEYTKSSKGVSFIHIKSAVKADYPIKLKELKEMIEDFRPPQSYYYLDREQTCDLAGRMMLNVM